MKKTVVIGLLAMVLVGFTFGAGLASEQVVIQGQVTAEGQLMDNAGNVYDIVDTDAGNEVVELVGQKVEIDGTLTVDGGGNKVLAIGSFRIIE